MKFSTKKTQIILGVILIIGGIALAVYGFHFFGTLKYKVGNFIHHPKIKQIYIAIGCGIAATVVGAILVYIGKKKKISEDDGESK